MSAMLIIRGLWSLLLAFRLARLAAISWPGYLDNISWYLATDGPLAAILGAMLLRESIAKQRRREMVLGVTVLTDAIGRTVSGVALMMWPGIGGFPVTAVLFIGIMAAGTVSVGLVEAWLTAREEMEQRGRRHSRPQFMAGPVGLASLASIGFAVAAIAWIGSLDRLRVLLSGFVAAAGVVALTMAWSRRSLNRRGETDAGTHGPGNAQPEAATSVLR
jgi:hypothetical protein